MHSLNLFWILLSIFLSLYAFVWKILLLVMSMPDSSRLEKDHINCLCLSGSLPILFSSTNILIGHFVTLLLFAYPQTKLMLAIIKNQLILRLFFSMFIYTIYLWPIPSSFFRRSQIFPYFLLEIKHPEIIKKLIRISSSKYI